MPEQWLTREEVVALAQENRGVIAVACPHCLAPLLTKSVIIEGMPSVCLSYRVDGGSREKAILHVSSCEGDFAMDSVSDARIPKNARLQLFCSRCGKELPKTEENCGVCRRGKMVWLKVLVGERKVRNVCPQRGCEASHEGEFSLPEWSSTFATSMLLGAG